MAWCQVHRVTQLVSIGCTLPDHNHATLTLSHDKQLPSLTVP
jgi:hypothetical protein